MQLEKTDNYLKQTQELAKNIQSAFWELGKRLCRIRGSELWKGTYSSYEDFLEEIQVTRSMDTKLRTVYLRFKDAISPGKIAEIGISKLYLIASRVEDNTQAAKYLETALNVGRADLQEEINEDKFGQHEHQGDRVSFIICSTCQKWIRIRDE